MAQETTLNREQQARLLAMARASIARALRVGAAEVAGTDDPAFAAKGAAFVTLTKGGRLRGCIGSLRAVESLADSVRGNAVSAALHDPRFAPLSAAELAEVRIEISVLGEPEPLPNNDPAELLAILNRERPGLILSDAAGHRATFLPQVWEQLPRAEDFLAALCRKAGLPAGAWKTEALRYQRYSVHHFEEPA